MTKINNVAETTTGMLPTADLNNPPSPVSGAVTTVWNLPDIHPSLRDRAAAFIIDMFTDELGPLHSHIEVYHNQTTGGIDVVCGFATYKIPADTKKLIIAIISSPVAGAANWDKPLIVEG